MVEETRETQIHEAGHAVASFFFAPGSLPEVWVDGPRSGRTEFNTQEDHKVEAQICMAGVVATKLVLGQPDDIAAYTMEARGAGEDLQVIYMYLDEVYPDDETRYKTDLGLKAFAAEVEAMLAPYQAKIVALADALEAVRKGDQSYLDTDEVEAVLK